ncbi:MAG: hypothetical protein ABFD94_00155, partial [Armatimonadia bacterium]
VPYPWLRSISMHNEEINYTTRNVYGSTEVSAKTSLEQAQLPTMKKMLTSRAVPGSAGILARIRRQPSSRGGRSDAPHPNGLA